MGNPDGAITLVHLGDIHGGAGQSATRLYSGLRSIDPSVRLVVPAPGALRVDGTVVMPPRQAWVWWLRRQIDRTPTYFLPRQERRGITSLVLPGGATRSLLTLRASLMHIHFLGHGSVRLASLSGLRCPVVWTLHDQWLMTSGHHYSHSSAVDRSIYRRQIARKQGFIDALRPTIIAPSRWIAQDAVRSGLLCNSRVVVIPNGIDTEHWRPMETADCRAELGLRPDSKVVAVGAVGLTRDPRKGWGLFCKAMASLVRHVDPSSLTVLVFGSMHTPGLESLPCRVVALGRLTTTKQLRLAYGAADVFVCPSTQENLPNTVMEASACGVPVVAFDTGGLPDLIEHQISGVLVRCGDTEGIAQGVSWVLGGEERRCRLGERARAKVCDSFDVRRIAGAHMALYDEILNGQDSSRDPSNG